MALHTGASIKRPIFRYGEITIYKDQIFGRGAYGAVYKAKCGHLPCAAKVLHHTTVNPYDPPPGRILERFQQECDFLDRIRHPNIVQYLGVCTDPDSKLPVLLMELMDESLTKMLEQSQLSLSYRVQVDLCHDISLAIAYLHSNEIIHRNLSGNNVLVAAGKKAKVTDFSMYKFNVDQRMTPLTMCPATLAYMSPEAFKEPPHYTDKLDVFSQGVIVIQVCSRQFPNPGPAKREIEDPRSPVGFTEAPVLERERRKEHIDLIDPSNPLLAIAMDCIEYRERDRPTASQLCERLAMLKEQPQYNSKQPEEQDVPTEIESKDEEFSRQERMESQEHSEQISSQRIAREVVWVDPNINNSENSGYVRLLKQVDNIVLFATDSAAKALGALKETEQGTEYRAITAGRGGEDFIRQLRAAGVNCSVMVFCSNVKYHKTWAKNYFNVAVTDETQDMFDFATWK